MAKVIQFYMRDASVERTNWRKPPKPAEVIELTRERREAMAKQIENAKAEQKNPIPVPWFGFF